MNTDIFPRRIDTVVLKPRPVTEHALNACYPSAEIAYHELTFRAWYEIDRHDPKLLDIIAVRLADSDIDVDQLPQHLQSMIDEACFADARASAIDHAYEASR